MSENGESFEKIEQSALNDKHSSESPANEMISSSNQVKASQVKATQAKDIELELGWEDRDIIIRSLNQHTKLLAGQTIKSDVRDEIKKANIELVATLMNLPMKIDQSQSSESVSAEGGPNEENEVILDLSWEMRSKIVDALMTNHQIALLDADSVAGEFKSKLIAQNNELACELFNLNSRKVSDRSSVHSAANESKRSEVAILKEEFEKLKAQVANQSAHSSAHLHRSDALGSDTGTFRFGSLNQPNPRPSFGSPSTSFATSLAKIGLTPKPATDSLIANVGSQPLNLAFGTSTGSSTITQSSSLSKAWKFGTTPSTLFGSSSTGLGDSNVVGTTIKFNPPLSSDLMIKHGSEVNVSTRHQCITCMEEYKNKSLEELRYEDSRANRKETVSTRFDFLQATQPTSTPFAVNLFPPATQPKSTPFVPSLFPPSFGSLPFSSFKPTFGATTTANTAVTTTATTAAITAATTAATTAAKTAVTTNPKAANKTKETTKTKASNSNRTNSLFKAPDSAASKKSF